MSLQAETSKSSQRLLLEMLIDSANIRRWNDQINPMDFTELDKQSHKMIIAYVLARFEDDTCKLTEADWSELIEGFIFEMLHRVVLTDIKPPIYHRITREKGDQLNQWVTRQLWEILPAFGEDTVQRFEHYFDPAYTSRAKRLLDAAHYFASKWEFTILYNLCPFVYGIDRVKQEIEKKIEAYDDLIGVQKIRLKKNYAGFVDLCGQLRFQKRWSQSPRIPATSVLGHMLIVAISTYVALLQTRACSRRKIDGFFAGLFHDLPEILTRDITTPVKTSITDLDGILKEIEREEMEKRLLPLLPESWHKDILYYTENEFENRIIDDNGDVLGSLTFEQLDTDYNAPAYRPVDGKIIRACDHLAAFVEAVTSIRHGVTSTHLTEGLTRLFSNYQNTIIGPVDFGALFHEFNPDVIQKP